MCVTVVQLSRSFLHEQINRVRRRCFSVSLYRFFFPCLVYFFNTIFPFGLFFFILTADPAGHALGSIYILSLSPEFYFEQEISKVLDLHTILNTPGDAVFCYTLTVFFSCLVSFFKHYFSFWPIFLYSYCWPCWSCTWINIYFKLKSGVLFWKRDFKSSWSAYWPSLRPDKNHKLSRHVPPLKQLNFFQC